MMIKEMKINYSAPRCSVVKIGATKNLMAGSVTVTGVSAGDYLTEDDEWDIDM